MDDAIHYITLHPSYALTTSRPRIHAILQGDAMVQLYYVMCGRKTVRGSSQWAVTLPIM